MIFAFLTVWPRCKRLTKARPKSVKRLIRLPVRKLAAICATAEAARARRNNHGKIYFFLHSSRRYANHGMLRDSWQRGRCNPMVSRLLQGLRNCNNWLSTTVRLTMWKMLNIRADKRTAINFAILPVILFVRVPFVLLFWVFEFMQKWFDIALDYMPGWRS